MSAIIRLSFVAAVVMAVVGCQQPEHVITTLPQPITPNEPSVKPPSPPPLTAVRPKGNLKGAKIVIDAGHGGKDPGTRGVSTLPEKNIVLAIANEVAQTLAQRGARVISTRTTDRFLELDERAAIAQRNNVDLFVAIHADSATRPDASGSTVYIGRSPSRESLQAARCIVSALSHAGIECRGIHNANYRVLVAHSRPAVLVECGYLTNAGNARNLNTASYRSRIAAAIANGIADYAAR